jgi:cell division protein FtsQ
VSAAGGAGRRRGLPTPAGVAAPSDRRFRRPDARPGRRRPIVRAVRRLVRVGLPAVLTLAASAWLARAVLDSQLLRVDHLVISGTTRLTPQDVEALVPGLRGTHILAVDFEEYRQQVLASPWVRDVSLSRMLPSTIEFQVEERQPVAAARLGQALLLIDAQGVAIEPAGPAHRDLDLPIVDGLAPPSAPGRPTPSVEAMRLVARFLRAVGETPALRDRVSQIDASRPRDLVVLLDDDPAWLHLGDTDLVERLERYLEWASALRDGMPALDYVDLRFGERIVVHAGDRRTEWSKE